MPSQKRASFASVDRQRRHKTVTSIEFAGRWFLLRTQLLANRHPLTPSLSLIGGEGWGEGVAVRQELRPQQEPSARKLDARHRLVPPLPVDAGKRRALLGWHEQGAQSFKTVGRDPALPRQFAQGLLHARGKQAGLLRDFRKEKRARPT